MGSKWERWKGKERGCGTEKGELTVLMRLRGDGQRHHWAGKGIQNRDPSLGRGVKMGKHALGTANLSSCVSRGLEEEIRSKNGYKWWRKITRKFSRIKRHESQMESILNMPPMNEKDSLLSISNKFQDSGDECKVLSDFRKERIMQAELVTRVTSDLLCRHIRN